MNIKTTIDIEPEDVDKRVCIEQFDKDGTLVVRSYGPSPAEYQEAHNNHECDAFCDICYKEAMKTCSKNPDTCDSIPPGSCGPDCHGFKDHYS